MAVMMFNVNVNAIDVDTDTDTDADTDASIATSNMFHGGQRLKLNFLVIKDNYSTTIYSALTSSSLSPSMAASALASASASSSTSSTSSSLSQTSLVFSSDLLGNITAKPPNITRSGEEVGELLRMIGTSIILGLMILITIIGNVFVIAAIILERNLQNVANYLVASLAVADLFVACLVMPLGAVYEISQGWILGPELCDIWTSCDVLCCTASILHLVAIAVDRYWAVTNIDYIHSRSSRRVFLMIFCVWTAAVIVSLAPQFGWKDPDYLQRIEQQKCMVSQDVAYQVFATCCTFYVPLLVILVLYWKIYQTARKRIHRRRPKPNNAIATTTITSTPATIVNSNPDNNNQLNLRPQKKRKRLRFRMGKRIIVTEEAPATVTTTTSELFEGNSTNTVDTMEMEDTEFSSSNVDCKSRTGNETSCFLNIDKNEKNETSTTPLASQQITTVSHLIALAHQERQQQQQQQQHKKQYMLKNRNVLAGGVNLVNNNEQKSTIIATCITTNTTTVTITTAAAISSLHHTELNSENISPPQKEIVTEEVMGVIKTSIKSVPEAVSSKEDINGDIMKQLDIADIVYTKPTTTATATTAITTATTITTLKKAKIAKEEKKDEGDEEKYKIKTEVDNESKDGQQTAEEQDEGVEYTNNVILRRTSLSSALSPQIVLVEHVTSYDNNTPTHLSSSSVHKTKEFIQQPTTSTTTTVVTTTATTILTTILTSTISTSSGKHVSQPLVTSIVNPLHKVTKRKETLEAKRERKAAKTLAIITGAFVICWLPFFVMALLLPLCDICHINDNIASLFLWLGYFNSTLNPVIYTIFSPEFRQAFKHILFGRHRPVHYRTRKI